MTLAAINEAVNSLEEIYETSADGRGRLVLVTGGQAVGKTSLLHAFLVWATASGAVVLEATGSRAERNHSGGLIGQLFQGTELAADAAAHVSRLGAIEPTGNTESGQAMSPAQLNAMRELGSLILKMVQDRPVVVVVDDVRYGDSCSLEFLLYLQRRISASRVLLILADREHSQLSCPSFHAEITRLPHHRIRLSPLCEKAVREIISDAVGGEAAEKIGSACYEYSGGNPMLVNALVEDYRASSAGAGGGSGQPLDAGVAYGQAVMTCLYRWDSAVLKMAQGLAIMDGAGSPAEVARLLGAEATTVAQAVDVLTEACILRDGRFRHRAGRDAVLNSLPTAERSRLHLSAAERLHQRGGSETEIARQLVAAGTVEERWQVCILRNAAEEALADGEPQLAARYLELALGACADDAERLAVTEELAHARARINPSAAAQYAPFLKAAMDLGKLSARGIAALVRHAVVEGDSDTATKALGVLANIADQADSRVAAQLLLRHLWFYGAGRGSVCSDEDAETAAMADPWNQAMDDLTRWWAEGDHSAATIGAEHFLKNSRLDDSTLDALAIALIALIHARQAEKALSWCDVLISKAAQFGAITWQAVLVSIRAYAELRCGAVADAAASAEQATAMMSPRSWGVLVGLPLTVSISAYTAMGRMEDAASVLRRRVPDTMPQTVWGLLYLRARGKFHLASGRPLAAIGDFEKCEKLMKDRGLSLPSLLPLKPDLAEANLRLGFNSVARDLATEQICDSAHVDEHTRAMALRVLAACNEPTQSVVTLKQAIDYARASGDRFEMALALDDLSRSYQKLGQFEHADEASRRAAQETRACFSGVTRGGRDRTEKAGTDPASEPAQANEAVPPLLSEAEYRVAVLAVRGHTNRAIGSRLYITVSTVEQHLTRVYRKLGASGRADLSACLAIHHIPAAPEDNQAVSERTASAEFPDQAPPLSVPGADHAGIMSRAPRMRQDSAPVTKLTHEEIMQAREVRRRLMDGRAFGNGNSSPRPAVRAGLSRLRGERRIAGQPGISQACAPATPTRIG